MSETSEHAARLLRAYQAQEKRFVERRFPLQFAPEVPAIRELYSQAKGFRWNPETDIAWDRFDAARYAQADARGGAAGRGAGGRGASIPGSTESTALLVRFCLESGALGMDAKLFLSFRPAEEAKHLEVCHMLAERLGGYEPDPGDAGLARASNHPFAQAALDPELPVEAYVAALGALDDQLDLNLHLSHLQHARDEIVRKAIRLIAGDRAAPRDVRLGVPRQPRPRAGRPRARGAVVDAVHDILEQRDPRAATATRGCCREKSREPGWPQRTRRRAADSAPPPRRRSAASCGATIAQVRERFAIWGLALPHVIIPISRTTADLGTLRRQGDSPC